MAQLTEEQGKLLTHLVEQQQSGIPTSAVQIAARLKARTDDGGRKLVHKHISNTRGKLRYAAGNASYDPFEVLPTGYRLRSAG